MKTCKNGHDRDDAQVRCLVCRRAATVAWKSAHPERVRESDRMSAARSRADGEKRAKRYAGTKTWQAKNRVAENAKALARYYVRKAEGLAAKSTDAVRRWRAANPARAHEAGVKENGRRLRLKHNALGSHTLAEFKAICARQHGLCAACGDEAKLEQDHIVPLSMGGSDYAWNIQGLCGPCNKRKGASLPSGTQIGLYDRVPELTKV